MSILPIRSRPLDPLLLDDGLVSGSSIPSAVVYGHTLESAMANEIFNDPDAWSVQFHEDGNVGHVVSADNGFTSNESLSRLHRQDSGRDRKRENQDSSHAARSSTKKPRVSKSMAHSEGYHLKRKSRLQPEAFTIKPFENRHRVIPLSSSSISDSLSLASSTPSLNSSLPTVSDEDSMHSQSKSLPLTGRKWQGIREAEEDPSASLSLLALMDPSNKVSPETGERMSILWSSQNVFRAFPTPKGREFDFRGLDSSQPSSESIDSSSRIGVASALPLTAEGENSSPTAVMKPRRNVPALSISTASNIKARTRTTIITLSSPEKSSPASVTVVSASTTWSILELYGDSPKPSPKGFLVGVPKTSGHLNSSFKSSDLQVPSQRRLPPPKSAFASKFSSQQLNPHLASTSKIVELPADFVIPPLPRTNSKLRGPRKVPSSPMRNKLTKEPDLPPLPRKDAPSSKDRKSKIRPLPKIPRAHSPPPPVPSLPSVPTVEPMSSVPLVPSIPLPLPVPSLTPVHTVEPRPSAPPVPPILLPLLHSMDESTADSVPPPVSKKLKFSAPSPVPEKSASSIPLRVKKSSLRARVPPPPLPLSSPLPPLPEPEAPKAEEASNLKGIETPVLPRQDSEIPGEVLKIAVLAPSPVEQLQKAIPSRPERRRGDTLLFSPPQIVAEAVPARPSRKNVISPLPSPILHRVNALESLQHKNSLSPPNSGHKPRAASESSMKSAESRDDTLSPPSAQLSARKSLKKSVSASSLPLLVPEVPVPPVGLAGRIRKGSIVGVDHPKHDGQFAVNALPVKEKGVEISAISYNLDIELAGNDSSSLSLATSSNLSVSASANAVVGDMSRSEADSDTKVNDPTARTQDARKVEVPSLEGQKHSPASFTESTLAARASPILVHKKGGSLNSAETRPILKAHKKSSSSVSFRPPLVEPPLPDAAVLAKRLTVRKNSVSNGFRPPLPDAMPRKDSASEDSRPHFGSTASEPTISTQPKQEDERPVILKSTSAMYIPYKNPKASTSSSRLKDTSDHSRFPSSSAPKTKSTTPLVRPRNGSISIRRPLMEDVPLPKPSVLAQRIRTSSQSGRPSSGVSDAFSVPVASADKSLAPSSSGNLELLPAPKPVVASGAWVPQFPRSAVIQSAMPGNVSSVQPSREASTSLPSRGATIPGLVENSHRRLRSISGTKVPRATPPVPSLPSETLRSSPALPIPKVDQLSRTQSPSILIRNKTASPVPSSMHIRFRSIDKHPVPPIVSPQIKNSELERARGRQPADTKIPTAKADNVLERIRGRQLADTKIPTAKVIPRRSASVAPEVKQVALRRRSSSFASSRAELRPPPPLPLNLTEVPSPSESTASAGSRGRVSPFPSRPISRASLYTAKVGA